MRRRTRDRRKYDRCRPPRRGKTPKARSEPMVWRSPAPATEHSATSRDQRSARGKSMPAAGPLLTPGPTEHPHQHHHPPDEARTGSTQPSRSRPQAAQHRTHQHRAREAAIERPIPHRGSNRDEREHRERQAGANSIACKRGQQNSAVSHAAAACQDRAATCAVEAVLRPPRSVGHGGESATPRRAFAAEVGPEVG